MPDKARVFRPPHARTPADVRHAKEKRRGSARQRGYTKRWEKQSKLFKAMHPLCLGCQAVGKTSQTRITDHIVPHKGDDALFNDPNNRQPCCEWHHDVIKAILEQDFEAGRIGSDALRLDSPEAIALTLHHRPQWRNHGRA